MGDNRLCCLGSSGRGTYTTEGITELCEGLRGCAVTSLKCAAAPDRSARYRARPRWHPPSPLPLARSLDGNQLCGLGRYGGGTYTTEGITKLCKGLRGSAITSLKCAAAP